MRSTFIATALVTAGIFTAGYVVGEISGVLPTYAAATTATTATPTVPSSGNGPGPGFHNRSPHADGTVTAINGDTITVKADADDAGSDEYTKVTTINVNGSTTYDAGTTKASIKVGSYIVAEGTLNSDGTTLTATSVHGGTAGGAGHFGHFGHRGDFGPHADGTVTAVNGNTVTIKADAAHAGSNEQENVTSIVLTSSTTYDAGFGATATKGSIKNGVYIIATGTLSSDGKTLTASRVGVLSGTPGQRTFRRSAFGRGGFDQNSGQALYDQRSFTQNSSSDGFK